MTKLLTQVPRQYNIWYVTKESRERRSSRHEAAGIMNKEKNNADL